MYEILLIITTSLRFGPRPDHFDTTAVILSRRLSRSRNGGKLVQCPEWKWKWIFLKAGEVHELPASRDDYSNELVCPPVSEK